MVTNAASQGPVVRADALSLRLLGLELESDGSEAYEVLFCAAPSGTWSAGRLRHTAGASWSLADSEDQRHGPLALGLPDELFATALRHSALPSEVVAGELPHWPADLQGRLARRGATGSCTIAFDADWFVARLTGSPMDRPLVLPGATRILGLEGLAQAQASLAATAEGLHGDPGLITLLKRGLAAAHCDDSEDPWTGEGRLIGESTWGDLTQVGGDIVAGCQAALGAGPLQVSFDPREPMGVGFAPEVPSAAVVTGDELAEGASAGTGVEIGEVEPGCAAEAAGLMPGMVATRLGRPELALHVDGDGLLFEDILAAIDGRRSSAHGLEMTFNTAAPLTHWYAVELPAACTLAALGARAVQLAVRDAGVGKSFDALCGDALLWREPTPRLFLGAAGSVTCAHVDICPQVQLAHGLLGSKVLGVASHEATARLRAEHGACDDGSIDEGASHVPSDRPLSARQSRLLGDHHITLVLLQAGDLAVFHSGALHFASNGAAGLSASLYHGVITKTGLPRLRDAAAAAGGSAEVGDEAYSEHLYASELLRLAEGRLRALG